jgi:alpha-L-arabinofuranosidase
MVWVVANSSKWPKILSVTVFQMRLVNVTPLKWFSRREFLRNSSRLTASVVTAGALGEFGLARSLKALGKSVDESLKASISVDAEAVRNQIDPHIYGALVEHIGRVVYGGLYEEGSPLSDETGFRKDVLAAARDWGVTTLRWPGGDFASQYHWEDAIGPIQNRNRKYNAAWLEEESNHFGTDEFMAYCKKVGSEPYLCINAGTGTIEEAANWVEYCNGTGNTHYANLRRKNGHAEPYQVRYWGLGNEVYGTWQIGHKNAEDYTKFAIECAKMMRWVDPTIRLVASGSVEDPTWNRKVLEELVNLIDYISVHDYEGADDYYEMLGSVRHFERNIRLMDDTIELTDSQRGKDPIINWALPEMKGKKRIEIACDEWNIWYRKRDLWRRDVPNPVEERYNLRDALWVASSLNLMHRMGGVVTLANLSQLVNSIAPIFTSEDGMFLQTTFFPMKLYTHECGSLYLASNVQSPTFSSKSYQDVPYLDLSATTDNAKKVLSLAVVNRHQSEPITSSIAIDNAHVDGKAQIFEINGASAESENSFSEPNNVRIVPKDPVAVATKFTYTFPAHSISLLKLNIAGAH